MSVFKSGDLVVLKSGGPTMTIDTVNTDIFDDSKITGVLCVWFVGDKLERVRFDHRAIDPVGEPTASPKDQGSEIGVEAADGYGSVLDNMVGAMNTAPDPVEAAKPAPRRRKAATHTAISEKTH